MTQRQLIITLTGLAGILGGILAGLFYGLFHDLPQINHLKQYKPSSVTTVYSADTRILDRFYVEKRFPVKIDAIPKTLIDALITIEDRDFFSHSGINLKAIVRAIVRDIQAGRFKEGASTLTQQIAKTLFLTNEKSIVRKIKELILSIQIERRYAKNEILELYLNQIYLGAGTYGVEAASRTYFNKSVQKVNLAEAALIAGLPKAPSIYSPAKRPDRAKKRRDIVLYQMRATKKITQQQWETAVNTPVHTGTANDRHHPSQYFIAYVKSILQNQFELQQIYSKGLNIQTTLHLDTQKQANKAVKRHMTALEQRMQKQGLDASKAQCALIAIDTASGAIRAMVGGKDFKSSQFNRAIQAKRQPGSAFKPFVYGAAIIRGAAQNDLLLDAPLSYQLNNDRIWQVNNFSKTFSGEMTFRKALALSKNTPVVRLMERIGPHQVSEFAKKAGISSPLYPNLSLALGTSEVSLLELTAAYIPFAHMGIKVAPFVIDKITDADSRLVYQHTADRQSVLSRKHAAIIADMLKAVIREGTGKKASGIKRDIAGKTGTTDNYKDALFIGFSPDLALGVWVGNDNSKTLGKYETGARAALSIWTDVMNYHLSAQPAQYFDIPDGLKMVYIDPDNGNISNQAVLGTVKSLVIPEDE